MRIAIISTICNAENVIASFIRYHKSVGFTDFIFFFDNPEEYVSINYAKSIPGVKVFLNNDDLKEMWKSCSLYEVNKKFLTTEFRAKQSLNTEVGIKFAVENKIDWVLHIDIDEAFYVEEGKSVLKHFNEMKKKKKFIINYKNHEAVVHKFETKNHYKEIFYFKVNPVDFSLKHFTQEQKKFVNNIKQIPNDFFFYYGNGKSAAMVSHDLIPDGPHCFKSKNQVYKYDGNDIIILHYPICGFSSFRLKYKRLGNFKDLWFNKYPIADYLGAFHLNARDISKTNDVDLIKKFYINNVLIKDLNTIKEGLDLKLFCKKELRVV